MQSLRQAEPFAFEQEQRWTVFTNHGHVLVCVARTPDLRVRDIAKLVGITERATQAILSDLDDAGFLDRSRKGRRNHYRVRLNTPLRHPLLQHATVGDLLAALPPPTGDTVEPRRLVI